MNENFDIKAKRLSILDTYGENFQKKEYITNPAIGRDEQIKQLILILLTPDKSAVLTGKPGVGKTATIEGLAYRIQRGLVPDVLKDYQVIKVNTSALLGVDPITGEAKVQTLIDELKQRTKLILFIDEIHTLIGTKGEALDFANMFKPALDRGDIKVIGARYPDVSLTIVQQAFSNALFDNRKDVNVIDFRKAIMNTKNVYPDVIKKSLPTFDETFKDEISQVSETRVVYESLDTRPE